jgi:hypothetical protein
MSQYRNAVTMSPLITHDRVGDVVDRSAPRGGVPGERLGRSAHVCSVGLR